MGLPLRLAIPLHAADCARLLGVEFLRQLHVPPCPQLLLCHHVLGLQWYDEDEVMPLCWYPANISSQPYLS
jgi:hypothetical protein